MVAQAMLSAAVLLILVVLPPRHGPVLLIPIQPGRHIASWALEDGTRLIGRGPLPGSLVVSGDRTNLMRAALTHWTLPVAGRGFGCGDDEVNAAL